MTAQITLREPQLAGYNPPKPFGLYENGAPIHETVRLLLGTVDVRDRGQKKTIKLSRNELRTRKTRSAKPRGIVNVLFEDGVSVSDYADFLKRTKLRNSEYFENLKMELTLSLVCKKIGRHTESFLYMYRIIEYISLAIPLLYATTESDFKRSHEFLKSLLTSEHDGDLKSLRTFLPRLSKSANLNEINFDFSVAGKSEEYISSLKKQIQENVLPTVQAIEFEESGDTLFRLPFDAMPGFLITVRNRMFHYRVGEKNIDLTKIGGSESICQMIMSEAIYWFSLLFTEIVRILAKKEI